jgi:hypothetical protein
VIGIVFEISGSMLSNVSVFNPLYDSANGHC